MKFPTAVSNSLWDANDLTMPMRYPENPSWRIEYVAETGVVQVAMQGAFPPKHFRQLLQEALAIAQRHGSQGLLVDARAMATAGGFLFEMFGLPGMLAELGFPPTGQLAIVHRPCARMPDLFRFLESLYTNSSFSVRFFADLEAASNRIKPGSRVTPESAGDHEAAVCQAALESFRTPAPGLTQPGSIASISTLDHRR